MSGIFINFISGKKELFVVQFDIVFLSKLVRDTYKYIEKKTSPRGLVIFLHTVQSNILVKILAYCQYQYTISKINKNFIKNCIFRWVEKFSKINSKLIMKIVNSSDYLGVSSLSIILLYFANKNELCFKKKKKKAELYSS